MSNVLIVCNTVLQVIFAVNLKFTEYMTDSVDLIISDHTASAKKTVDNSQKLKSFENVYYSENKEFVKSDAALISSGALGYYKDRINKRKILKKYIKLERSYDILLAANPDKFTNLLYEELLSKNKRLRYFLYEDGLSAYCVLGEILKRQRCAKVSMIHRLFDSLTGKKNASLNIQGVFLTNPLLCKWDLGIPFLTMCKIQKNKALLDCLNEMFGYNNLLDKYKEQYVFFEESYYEEKIKVNDVQLVEEIAKIIGKENLMIKIHPRNSVNRFREMGYKTNSNTFIPWELIMLNENYDDKILLSIASGSVANPFLYLGIKTKTIILMKCAEGDFGASGNIYNDFLLNSVYLKNKDIFIIPESIEQLKGVLKQ